MEDLRQLDTDLNRFLSSQRALWSDSASFSLFLRTIDNLLHVIQTLDSSNSPSSRTSLALDIAEDILQKSMSRLQREFSSLLADANPSLSASADVDEDLDDDSDLIPVAHPIQDYNIIIDALPSGIIQDLGQIARRMAAAGFGKDCANAYCVSRRDFVDESMSRLGIRNWSKEEVQEMRFAELEFEIMKWNQAAKVVFLILFPSERRLADRVFVGLAPIADLGFADACRDVAVMLLRFAEGVATGPESRAPERLFKVVDMYEVLRELLPEIAIALSGRYCEFLVREYEECCVNLGATIRGIFTELEKLIRQDPVKTLAGCNIHPITRYVINYLHAASAAWRTLEEVMVQEEDSEFPVTIDHLRSSTSLSAQIGWIMERLNGNLEAKSKACGNEAMGYLFLMNNGQYMVEKLAGSELKQMLGDDWIRGQVGKIRQWLTSYQKKGWMKVMATVQFDRNAAMGSLAFVRQKLKYFSQYLEEICKEQSGWVVPNRRLREEIRTSVVRSVIPVYKSFLESARTHLGRQMNGCVVYSPEDAEARIRQIFQASH